MSAVQPGEASNSHDHVSATTAPAADSSGEEALSGRCAQVHQKIQEFLARKYEKGGDADTGDEAVNVRLRRVQRQTHTSLRVIAEALERYSLPELSLSYNGGKDCLVLLLLYLAALHIHATTHSVALPTTLPSVYIITPNPFAAVTRFVLSSSAYYRLHLTSYADPMREAFASYLSTNPSVRAIFVGTRRTDPHGATLSHFEHTDRGWPAFMRIHPVIDWHYADIWGFIKELGVEYCELYDQGYTSLGGVGDTKRNPALKVGGPDAADGDARGVEGQAAFRPAYELLEDDEERLGRDQ